MEKTEETKISDIKFSIEKKICKQCKKNTVEKDNELCEECIRKNTKIFKGGIRS